MDTERFAALMADMVKARAALGNVTKNKKANAGSHSYAYSDLAAVTASVAEAIDESKAALFVTQDVTTTEASVTCVTIAYHANGAKHAGAAMTLPVLKRDPQGFGSAISYARRYSMLAFWGIAAEDDDGKAAGDGPPPRQNGRQAPSDDHEAATILGSLREAAMDGTDTLNERFRKIPASDTQRAVWNDHGPALKAAAAKADDAKATA
ncbi:MAG: ERF family protein [Pseudomonadota bacterium]